MALWGNKDTKSVTGTITTVQNDTAIVGAGTAFTTELKVGQTLVIDTVPYTIASIQSDTALELQVAYAAVGAALLVVTANESPAYVAHADKSVVFGVDTTEAGVTDGVVHSGWVQVTVGTGGRAGRTTYETLVATGSIQADAENVAFPNT
jgi:hypothetical protein